MWFLLFSMGAVVLGAVGLPAARRLPAAPPPEAVVAGYFLLASLLRLLVRNARLAAFEKKARREARRKEDKKPTSIMGELGLGVGRGALQAVGGDVLGAGLSLATALLRGAASSLSAPPPPIRERRRAMRWEQLKTALSIAGVGLVCAGVAWEPLLHARVVRAANAASREMAGEAPPGATSAATMRAAVAPAGAPGLRAPPTSPLTATAAAEDGAGHPAAHPGPSDPASLPGDAQDRRRAAGEAPGETPASAAGGGGTAADLERRVGGAGATSREPSTGRATPVRAHAPAQPPR